MQSNNKIGIGITTFNSENYFQDLYNSLKDAKFDETEEVLKLAIKIEPDNEEIENFLAKIMIFNRNKVVLEDKGKT
jgi:glycosyltransferase involved in cell wall biosynthesis